MAQSNARARTDAKPGFTPDERDFGIRCLRTLVPAGA